MSIVVAAGAIGLATHLAYPGANERIVRLAGAVLLLLAVVSPIGSLIKGVGDLSFDALEFTEPDFESGEYLKVSREALESGIRTLVADEFSLSEDDVRVVALGFDFEKMKAEKINIILTGKALLADYKRIERYISEQGLGECEVKVSFDG